jgi:hypothetical protein
VVIYHDPQSPMASNSEPKSTSPPPAASFTHTHSTRSNRPATIKTVVTSPRTHLLLFLCFVPLSIVQLGRETSLLRHWTRTTACDVQTMRGLQMLPQTNRRKILPNSDLAGGFSPFPGHATPIWAACTQIRMLSKLRKEDSDSKTAPYRGGHLLVEKRILIRLQDLQSEPTGAFVCHYPFQSVLCTNRLLWHIIGLQDGKRLGHLELRMVRLGEICRTWMEICHLRRI